MNTVRVCRYHVSHISSRNFSIIGMSLKRVRSKNSKFYCAKKSKGCKNLTCTLTTSHFVLSSPNNIRAPTGLVLWSHEVLLMVCPLENISVQKWSKSLQCRFFGKGKLGEVNISHFLSWKVERKELVFKW